MRLAIRKIALMVAAQATIFLFAANAQSKINNSCDPAVFGFFDAKTFLQFDKELRSALSEGDAVKMALLIEYPLRVGDSAGGYLIPDPASFQGHFAMIFPAALRKQITNESLKNIWCSYRGIAYANGTLWVQPSHGGYRIESVDAPQTKKPATVSSKQLELVCRTTKLRAAIDVERGTRISRLRLWNEPQSLNARPDLVAEGTQVFEGTGPCVHAYYKFHSGNQLIQVDDAQGCHESDTEPPQGAIGQITFTDDQGKNNSSWCY